MTTNIPSTPQPIIDITVPRSRGSKSYEKHPVERENHPLPLPQEPSGSQNEHGNGVEDFYGFRYIQVMKHGVLTREEVPLKKEDLLNPQLGDFRVKSHRHMEICGELYHALQVYLRTRPKFYVYQEELVMWNIPNQANVSPDLGVMVGVQNHPGKGALDLAKYGGTPLLCVETTSPSTRDLDVKDIHEPRSKYWQYERIGVPYYLIIDEAKQVGTDPPPIMGYRLIAGTYHPISPNQWGRVEIPPLDVSLGPHQDRVAWFNPNGQRLLGLAEEQDRANREQARADYAEEELRQLRAKLEALGMKE